MVNGRHFENTLAVGDLEVTDLDNIAHGLAHINDTEKQQQNRALDTVA